MYHSYIRNRLNASVIRHKTELLNDKQGFTQGEVIFHDNSRLEFAEVMDMDRKSKVKYRYHYMDAGNNLLFGYDNARRYPNLLIFPHHKHTTKNVEDSQRPEIAAILAKIARIIAKNKTSDTPSS